nr:hypothetical protein [Tanacetum cinerariifolium]
MEDLQLGVESYQKKSLTKPDTYHSDLKRKEAYIAYSNPRGFIYQNKDKQNRLIRIDELHKFSDGMLTDIHTALDDRLKWIRMQYLPQSILRKKLEELKLEKDGLDGKLAGLLKASKNLDNLIESQRPSSTVASTSAEGQNKDSSTSEDVASPNTPKPFIKFVKSKDSQSESKTDKQETPKKPQVKYAEQYRHSNKKPNVKGNQRNWNNLKSYQLGPEFVLNKKACFNCGDFSHLDNDCRKRVQRDTTRTQKHAYESPSYRSGGHRPHGAPMRPPHRSDGHRPHGASMRPSHRPAGHRPHGPSMNPMRPNMNSARPNRSFFIQAHSYENRHFLKSSAVWVPTVNKNNLPVNRKFSTGRRNFPSVNRKFPTASRKFTTGSTKTHTADMGRKGKA